jgi:glutamate-ammonia-ligase adenylyltransferase
MTSSAKGDADQLAARFVDGPHVSAPDIAEQRLTDWLTGLAAGQAAAIDDLLGRFPLTRTILLGIAEASPYLFDLVRADGARTVRVLQCEPELYLAHLIENTRREVLDASAESDVMQLLRRMKSEAALLIALCDIGGVWPVMRVTAALTDLAVAAVQSALGFLLRQETTRGRMSPPDPDHPEDNSGLIVLAMGKMGAGELNYSSDIDLIVFFEADAPTLAPDIEPQPFFVRVTQGLSRILQQRSGDGYVFRVDLRLQASGRRGIGRRPRHEAADADLSRAKRNRGRGPQCQDRTRWHPRDRVFRADPAADRRRPAPRIAGAANAGGAQCAGLKQLDHLRGARPAHRRL